MSKLYQPITTDLVNPELETEAVTEPVNEPVTADVPKDLYAAITTTTPEATEDAVVEQEVSTYSTPAKARLFTAIVPEKPNILAEERIFVYVPKAAYNVAGIAKFLTNQFNIVNGEVSLRTDYLNNAIVTNLLKLELITVVTELPESGEVNRIYIVPINATMSIGYVWNAALSIWNSIGTVELNLNNYYTKSEVVALIAEATANLDNYYTTTQVNALLDDMNTTFLNYYTKSQIDDLLSNVVVDLSNYYTKSEINTIISNLNFINSIRVYDSFEEANNADLDEGQYAFIVIGTLDI